jgi:hypothetical protein
MISVFAPSFLLLASSSSSATQESLPACCRRDGKHHCAMMMPAQPTAGDHRLRSIPEECPVRDPFITSSRAMAFAPPAAPANFAELVSHPAQHEQVLAVARVAEARSHQKRGPPPSLQS